MPTYRINLANGDFRASSDSALPDQAAALREGLKGAFAMGAEEVCDGRSFFAAEVSVALGGDVLERRMVVIGAARLRYKDQEHF